MCCAPAIRTLEEASTTLVERVAEWQAVAPGRSRKALRKVANRASTGNARCCRQATARFDAETAARLADLLAPIADPERLAEVGDRLVRCDSAAAFFARFDPASPS